MCVCVRVCVSTCVCTYVYACVRACPIVSEMLQLLQNYCIIMVCGKYNKDGTLCNTLVHVVCTTTARVYYLFNANIVLKSAR